MFTGTKLTKEPNPKVKENQIQKEKQKETFPDIDCRSRDDFLTSELKNDERHGKKDESLWKKIVYY